MMPQIWLDYQELGEWFNCDAATAREKVIAYGWSRRACSDGLSRAKLPLDFAKAYMIDFANVHASGADAATAISDLQTALGETRIAANSKF